MVLIAIGAATVRYFGRTRADAADGAQGDDEITRFLFGAANTGDYDRATDLVSDSLAMYTNGFRMGTINDHEGQDLLFAAMSYYDDHIEQSFWQLYDEVSSGDGATRSIAIRFVASGGFDGAYKQVEFAGFLDVVDGKLTEVRFVTDMKVFNDFRQAAGIDPLV